MQIDTGKISLIQHLANGERAAQVECDSKLTLRPGQYLQARNLGEPNTVLGCSLFPVGVSASLGEVDQPSPLSLGPIPSTWHPGTQLELRGPLGRGFQLPVASRLGLVALGESAARLLPLLQPALKANTDIVMFSTVPLPDLPTAIEIQPLSTLPEAIAWADFLALDLPIERLPSLRQTLGLGPHDYLSCPAQALITIPMPCAGIGECGACAVPMQRKGYKLVCVDGPVFDLKQLAW